MKRGRILQRNARVVEGQFACCVFSVCDAIDLLCRAP